MNLKWRRSGSEYTRIYCPHINFKDSCQVIYHNLRDSVQTLSLPEEAPFLCLGFLLLVETDHAPTQKNVIQCPGKSIQIKRKLVVTMHMDRQAFKKAS